MESTSENIGRQIRAARERKGMSQAELARTLGAHKNSPGNWERGLSRPAGPYQRALVELLDLPEGLFQNPYGEFERRVLSELESLRLTLESFATVVLELDRLVAGLEAAASPAPAQSD